MSDYSKIENDCIVLLNYLADNPLLWQTYRGVSDATGIALPTLYRIVRGWDIYGPNDWALGCYADKYGFEVRFVGSPGRILHVSRKL